MKNHHHNGPLVPTSPTARSVIHEAISARAYELWEGYGQPANRSDEIWLEAEAELATGRREPRRDPALPVSF